jgi:hypothetical protein
VKPPVAAQRSRWDTGFMRRGLPVPCFAAALALLAPVPAHAAATVGSSLRQRANLYVRCPGTCTALQSGRPGTAGISIPIDGVVTRWRIRAATMGLVRLRIVRSEPDGGYSSEGRGDWVRLDRPHEPGHDILYTFPVRMTVHAGDTVAVDRDARAGGIFHSFGQDASYAVAVFSPPLPDAGFDLSPTSSSPGRELLVNVDVEKDADGDGFGDESQDNCPTIANDQTDRPCSTPSPSTATPQGPTSTPVETTPPQRGTGSEGPPVAGEPPTSRARRRHSSRHRARPAPPAGTDPQRSHGRNPAARPTPPAPSGPDDRTHSVVHGLRPIPVLHERPAPQHGPASPRPSPPAPKTPSGTRHHKAKARQVPKTKPPGPGHRHGGSKTRPAPPRQPPPPWRLHNV